MHVAGPGSVQVTLPVDLEQLQKALIQAEHPLASAPEWTGQSPEIPGRQHYPRLVVVENTCLGTARQCGDHGRLVARGKVVAGSIDVACGNGVRRSINLGSADHRVGGAGAGSDNGNSIVSMHSSLPQQVFAK